MLLSENGRPKRPQEVAIELNRVSRYFGTHKAVDEVTFSVASGEVFGYIGPNGAGKTTSMRILATLEMPTEGEAWVDGFSVIDDPDRVRYRLGWMPDGFEAYPNVNVKEYLDFFARAYGLRGNERRNALQRVMGFTQLDRLAAKSVDSLSKGMKQRLGLGRALIHDPAVLILDEPAAGLDPRARIELRDMIKALADQGKSLLISSHILTELAEMCDRVGIIEKGQMLAVGSVDEILHRHRVNTGNMGDNKTQLIVQVVSDPQVASSFLAEHEEVENIAVQFNQLIFSCPAQPEFHADLLTRMVAAEIRVSSFVEKKTTLEEAFLTVTKGIVQ